MQSEVSKKIILVVEDDSSLRDALISSLTDYGYQTIGCSHAEHALNAILRNRPDLAIVDLRLPDSDGITLTASLRDKLPMLPVIIVTGFGDVPSAVKAMKSGASDFLTKPLDETKLFEVTTRLLNNLPGGASGEVLTDVEMQVLKLVSSGLSNKEIAFQLNRSIRTVENHRHRLMKKLKLGNHADLVRYAISIGITGHEDRK